MHGVDAWPNASASTQDASRQQSANFIKPKIVDKAILLFSVNLVTYTKFSQQWFRLDHALHDITPQEESFPLYRKKSKGIGLDSWDDLECYENTRFTSDQLCRIYNCFGLDEYLLLQQETQIRVPTRGQNQRGQACYYRFDPEELFLYTLTKIATGKVIEHYAMIFLGARLPDGPTVIHGCSSIWLGGMKTSLGMRVYFDSYLNSPGLMKLLKTSPKSRRFIPGMMVLCMRLQACFFCLFQYLASLMIPLIQQVFLILGLKEIMKELQGRNSTR